jgi:hypothetical protein
VVGIAELERVMRNFRNAYDQNIAQCMGVPISVQRRSENLLFENYKDLVFDIVHASCLFFDDDEQSRLDAEKGE